MLAHSFLIKSSSKLLVTRTGIKAWSSSILGQIRPLILELLALEWRKFHTFELEYLWSQLANLDQILCVASLGWGKRCIRFGLKLVATKSPHWLIMGKVMSPLFLGCFWSDPFILPCNQDMHKISDKFAFRPDRTTDYGVSCPWGLKISHRLTMGKLCLHASSFIFDRIIIKLAGNQDRHKSSDEFKFGPLVSMAHLYVFFLNEIWPWHIGLRWVIVALWATC